MILFINVNSIAVESVLEDTLVIDCKMIESFCNHIGSLLIDGLTDTFGMTSGQLLNQPSKLLLDYKQENEVGFAAIISEWEQRILPRLFNETILENQYFDFPIPQEYVDWLSLHIDDIYSEAGKKLERDGNVIHLSVVKLQKDVFEEVRNTLEYSIQDTKKDALWFTFSDGRINEDSEFVKDVARSFPDIRFMTLETYMDLMESESRVNDNANREETVNTGEIETAIEETMQMEETETAIEETMNTDEVETVNEETMERTEDIRRKPCNILTFNANGVFFDMISIDGGVFTMGATPEQQNEAWDCEKPKHRVTLSNFYLGKFEVTQALWQAVMGYNPSPIQGDNLPVVKVSWNDCQIFISKLNDMCSEQLGGRHFALPTEAQWEYAARGGNKSRDYKYGGSNNINYVAWFLDNSNKTPHAVGMKSSNELGLYDMTGNVDEWCSDWYGAYVCDNQTDPTGPSSGSFRVHRGGSWNGSMRFCRVSHRLSGAPNITDNNLGLRLALCL